MTPLTLPPHEDATSTTHAHAPGAPVLLKIGGSHLTDYDFLMQLPQVVRQLGAPVMIVHGGGVEISDLQRRLGIVPRYLDGVRITDAQTMSLVEMVLCGTANKRLVRYLVAGGVDALGLSGLDRGLMRAEKMPHPAADMAYTGQVVAVRGALLHALLDEGVTPVLAPVSGGVGAEVYNVNADHAAGAVAMAVGAGRVVFLTDVDGVLQDGQVRPRLTPDQAEALIADEVVFGGMIPKVRTAIALLRAGVPQTVITSLAGLLSHGGTTLTLQPDAHEAD